ncbi:MAG: hypothetical protein AAB657_00910 [Patescibacteria group bacterium]
MKKIVRKLLAVLFTLVGGLLGVVAFLLLPVDIPQADKIGDTTILLAAFFVFGYLTQRILLKAFKRWLPPTSRQLSFGFTIWWLFFILLAASVVYTMPMWKLLLPSVANTTTDSVKIFIVPYYIILSRLMAYFSIFTALWSIFQFAPWVEKKLGHPFN